MLIIKQKGNTLDKVESSFESITLLSYSKCLIKTVPKIKCSPVKYY